MEMHASSWRSFRKNALIQALVGQGLVRKGRKMSTETVIRKLDTLVGPWGSSAAKELIATYAIEPTIVVARKEFSDTSSESHNGNVGQVTPSKPDLTDKDTKESRQTVPTTSVVESDDIQCSGFQTTSSVPVTEGMAKTIPADDSDEQVEHSVDERDEVHLNTPSPKPNQTIPAQTMTNQPMPSQQIYAIDDNALSRIVMALDKSRPGYMPQPNYIPPPRDEPRVGRGDLPPFDTKDITSWFSLFEYTLRQNEIPGKAYQRYLGLVVEGEARRLMVEIPPEKQSYEEAKRRILAWSGQNKMTARAKYLALTYKHGESYEGFSYKLQMHLRVWYPNSTSAPDK